MNPVSLLFYLAPREFYRTPLVSRNEIYCGPDAENCIEDGRVVSIRTPEGEFDVAQIIAKLPAEQNPELVIVKADASRRLIPRGLSSIRCPKVLILGDSHHLHTPISFLIRYASAEKFDFAISDHDKHHMHWFRSAGLSQVHWIPGFNFCLRPRPIEPAPNRRAIFVGQVGRFHPYRCYALDRLRSMGVPLVTTQAIPVVAADLYASNAACLNISLNGDLNLRVFEVLGSGGLLVTDRISEASGLYELFEDGKHLVVYDSIEDLAAKIGYYLDHPAEALAIRSAGHEKILAEHSPEIKRQQLLDLVFGGSFNPECTARDSRWEPSKVQSSETFCGDLAIYEYLQDRHLTRSNLLVFGPSSTRDRLAYLADLPRLQFQSIEQSQVDVEMLAPDKLPVDRILFLESLCKESFEWLGLYPGNHLLIDRFREISNDDRERLAKFGFAQGNEETGLCLLVDELSAALRLFEKGHVVAARDLLKQVEPESLDESSILLAAQLARNLGENALGCGFFEKAARSDRANADLLLSLAESSVLAGDAIRGFKLLREAERLSPLVEGANELRETLAREVDSDDSEIVRYSRRIGEGSSVSILDGPRRILVLTNLFPPQELGGYGRKMWEFAHEFRRRGHKVFVVTGDAPYLLKNVEEDERILEPYVHRLLTLVGEWKDGKAQVAMSAGEAQIAYSANRKRVLEMIERFDPQLCLVGNLDFIGFESLGDLFARDIPVVQCLGNMTTGWPVNYKPAQVGYVPGPASHYLLGSLRASGYAMDNASVVYPGARTDFYYRELLPTVDIPRIAFAGLLMAYKGAHTLMAALGLLKENGIKFQACIAGDSTDRNYVDGLKRLAEQGGFLDWIEFPGFLNRRGLANLFCRSNILVFPSLFEEPFGISQVEAMASGLAVISSGRGGSGEIVRDGVDGLLFEGENPVDLARKIAMLAADPERWLALCQAGRERALEFSIPASVDKIESLFSSMVHA